MSIDIVVTKVIVLDVWNQDILILLDLAFYKKQIQRFIQASQGRMVQNTPRFNNIISKNPFMFILKTGS